MKGKRTKGEGMRKGKFGTRFLAGVSAFLFACLFLAGCNLFGGQSTESQGGGNGGGDASGSALRVALGAPITTLDTTQAFDVASLEAIYNLNSGLMRLDENGVPQPELAESVEVSDDKTTYTFTLREGIEWSNGEPITAEDFRYAWFRMMNPETAGPYSTLFTGYIEGAQAYFDGEASEDEVGVRTPDERTITVDLINPTPYFLSLTAYQPYSPLSREFVEEAGDEYAQGPESLLSSGPYELTEYSPEQGTTMVKNDDYWDAENTSIERVDTRVVTDADTRLNLYETGELDITSLTSEQVERFRDDPEFHTYTIFQTDWLRFNFENPAMANVDVRKAIQTGIDKQALVDTFLNDGSKPANGLVPPGANGPGDEAFREAFEEPAEEFDPEAAREYWQAGVEELGEEPTLSILISESSVARDVATFIQGQLQENIGAEVEIEVAPFDARLERTAAGDFQTVYGGYGYDYDDPTNWLRLMASGSGYASDGFQSDEYDSLLEEAETETDPEERMRILADAEELLIGELTARIPLYYVGVSELRKDYIKGETRNAQTAVEYKDWTLDK